MPLTIGGKRPGLTDEQLIERLAECWVDAEEHSGRLRELEEKVDRQGAWLDSHRDDPRYGQRLMEHIVKKEELRREMNEIHAIASQANKIVEKMDAALRQQARDHIHAWAGTGNVGVYALAWNLVPDQSWLDDAYTEAATLRETVEVPF